MATTKNHNLIGNRAMNLATGSEQVADSVEAWIKAQDTTIFDYAAKAVADKLQMDAIRALRALERHWANRAKVHYAIHDGEEVN